MSITKKQLLPSEETRMPLTVSPKTNPNNPNSAPAAREPVRINQPTQSTARAQALRDRLTGKAPSAPIAPRPAGSTARRNDYANQSKYPVPAPATPPTTPPVGKPQPMADIAPPPSGNPLQRAAEATGAMPEPSPAAVVSPATSTSGMTPPAAEATSEPVSPHFAALSRKERQVRQAQQDLKAREEAFAAKQAEYVPKERLTSETLKTLAEAGIPYDRLVELQLAQANPDPNQQLVDKITQLEEKLAKVDKTFEERDTLQEQQALTQIKRDAQLLVESDPAYETIAATNSVDAVVSLIHKVFKAEGEILSVEEAAQAVEEKLLEREYQRYEALGKLQKIKARLAPKVPTESQATATQEVAATAPQQRPQQTTLTNAGSQVTRQLTPRERAIARIKGDI